jgi:rhodanese-related sulfurtransferase
MKKKVFFAALVVLAIGLAAVWGPARVLRAQALENTVAQSIARGDHRVSPAELATLMQSRQVALALFDLRDEARYNWFHIIDAKRITVKDLPRVGALPDRTVKMLVADDAHVADEAYRTLALAGTKQVYVLAGGVGSWLELFGKDRAVLAGAFGERHPASYPDIEHMALPKFEPKVKLGAAGGKKASGGCGG